MDSYTRTEQYLNGILNGTDVPEPYTREEQLLYDIAKNGGGGGASAVTVTFSVDSETFSANKTIAEIVSAFNSGSIVIGKYADESLGVTLVYSLDSATAGDETSVAVFSSTVNFGDGCLIYQFIGISESDTDTWSQATTSVLDASDLNDADTSSY